MGFRGSRAGLLFVLVAGLLLAAASPAAAALNFAGKWGVEGAGPGEFQYPEGVAAGPGNLVYVADSNNDRIQKFDAIGTFLSAWGTYGTAGDGRFSRPTGVAVDFAGNVYVVDTGNNRVQKFDANGVFLTKWGAFGTADGRFNSPSGIGTDALGNVYVADSGNNRIQKFDPAGNFVLKFGTFGTGNSQFKAPTDVAVDSAGNVYVTDSFNFRVKKFDSSGAFLTAWGSSAQFNPPYGIEVDASDNVLVSDLGSHRILQFSNTGALIDLTGGGAGSGDGQFNSPAGIGVDPAGTAYVADSGNHRIQRFRPGGAIVVTKEALPDDPQDFSFTSGGGLVPSTFQLDDDGDNGNALPRSRAFFAEPGSGYSVSESVPAGWDLESATCSDGSPPTNIDVSEGEVVTCTFTNSKRGQIVIVQDSQPNDPQDFDFTAGGGLSPTSFQLDDDGDNGNALSNTQVFDVAPGFGYSVSQATPAGWLAADTECSNGNSPSNIEVEPGETVTCTFASLNSSAGKIVVVKDSQPNDPQDFSFVGGGGVDPSFQLDDDGSTVIDLSNTRSFVVNPGSGHSVDEVTPAGWVLSSASCSDGSPTSNIDVSSGETVTCTFTNLKRGKIVVVKDSQPNDPQDFSFTAGGGLSPASFQLDDDGNNGNTLSNTREFADLVPGSGYSVSEDGPPASWDLTSATCSDGSSPANVDVGPGETVTCTFTNRKRGQIIIGKNATPNDPQDFSFTTGGGLSPGSFQLDDDGDELNALASTRTFADLVPGTGYSVAETTPAGWDLTSSTCSDGSSVSSIGVSPGETVTCVFNNRKRGNIVVLLNAQPDDPQDFNFTTSGGLSPSSFTLDDDGDNGNGLSNTRTFADLTPGNYGVAASATPGWLQQQLTCDDGSSPSSISVSAGETVTCTFLMTQNARIVVVKDAQPNDAQDFSFTAGGGLTPASFQLDDDSSDTNGLSSRQEFIVAPSSGYSVAESPPPVGWVATGNSCTDGSPVSNIDASAGETVTCTFVNLGQNYVRPKGATPFAVDLVPTYNTCTAPNRTHGPPLAFPSCNPPVQTSSALTVGSPDANGAAANSEGNVRFDVVWTPGGPDDTDVIVNSSIIDVRCKAGTTTCGNANAADGADYTGQLQGNVTLRVTDRFSAIPAGGGTDPATVVDIPLPWPYTCASTPGTAIGGTCTSNSSFDALVPGMVKEGKRTIWALQQVAITDGGADGQTGTAPNGLFMTQGVFAP